MKSPLRCAAWLLPFLLTGCFHLPFHRTNPAKNAALAPPLPLSQPVNLAVVELPPHEMVIPARPIYNLRIRPQPINSPARHKRRPDEASAAPEVAPNPEVSAIGQLSSGDPANFRLQTENSIATIEQGLNGINRNLNDQEKKTADQIREFVKEAKAALASGDVQGAHTLAAKAQVLLSGLTE
jgi:hypothetical protein